MKRLDDYEIAQSYIGKTINTENMLKVFDENGDDGKEYIAYCSEFDEDQCSLFNITTILYERWEFYGIQFSIILDVDNNTVKECSIFKHKDDLGGCWGRCISEDLIPSQQEIRIFRRIMDYITKGDDKS